MEKKYIFGITLLIFAIYLLFANTIFVVSESPNINDGETMVNDIVASDEFTQLKGFNQLGFKAEYGNSPPLLFDKESSSYENKKGNKFKSKFIEVESIYEEIDTSFFNVDEKPVKQKYIIKNLKKSNKNIKINLIYEIDFDFVVWNGTNYTISTTPQYFEAFEEEVELFPGLTETFLTGHTLTFGNNYYDFKDITDLDYSVSVYSLNGKNYINLEISQEVEGLGEFIIDPVIGFTERIIDMVNNPSSIFVIDLDKDADQDVVTSVIGDNTLEWYENDGSKPPSWTTHVIISSLNNARDSFPIDINNDGHIDVLSVSHLDDTIRWHENDGSNPPLWTSHVISTSIERPESIFAIDIDNDGDVDVVGGGRNVDNIVWYENNGASIPSWTPHVITPFGSTLRVFAADIDNDFDVDVLSNTDILTGSPQIFLHENDGSSPPNWIIRNITAPDKSSSGIFTIDIDNDGDVDVVSTSLTSDTVVWHENDGNSPPSWATRVISTSATGARDVFAIDIDDDGDVDILSAAVFGDQVAWYENNGGSPPSWTTHVINLFACPSREIFAKDIDNDGDVDVVSTCNTVIRWYESDLKDQKLSIINIIPIQVINDVDLVKGKTTLVRAVIKNDGATTANVVVKLFFENNLKDTKTDTINAGQQKNIDLFFVPGVAGNNKEIRVEVT